MRHVGTVTGVTALGARLVDVTVTACCLLAITSRTTGAAIVGKVIAIVASLDQLSHMTIAAPGNRAGLSGSADASIFVAVIAVVTLFSCRHVGVTISTDRHRTIGVATHRVHTSRVALLLQS